MNLVENKSLHSHLRDEEAVVVENAVRLAIDSVLNVLYGVNGARTREYQRMVADRDKEIQRLEGRLTEIERELQVLRGHGCTCGLFQNGTRISGNRQTGEQIRSEAGGMGPGVSAGPPECDMSLALGIYARPSSHFPSHYNESIVPSSPSCLGMNSTCTSGSSETSGITEAVRNLPPTPSSFAVKEEPCDIDEVLIEWELSEERVADAPERVATACPNKQSPSVDNPAGSCAPSACAIPAEHPEDNERQMLREKTPGQPPGFQNAATDQLKNKKNVPTSQLTEEAQRQKRAAWRAASKRYYARKVARQQASLQRVVSMEDRRRRPVPGLPEDSQMLRRDVWRAASRRLYGRRTQSLQYGHLMEELNPAGATQGPNGEGPPVNSGGITCS